MRFESIFTEIVESLNTWKNHRNESNDFENCTNFPQIIFLCVYLQVDMYVTTHQSSKSQGSSIICSTCSMYFSEIAQNCNMVWTDPFCILIIYISSSLTLPYVKETRVLVDRTHIEGNILRCCIWRQRIKHR